MTKKELIDENLNLKNQLNATENKVSELSKKLRLKGARLVNEPFIPEYLGFKPDGKNKWKFLNGREDSNIQLYLKYNFDIDRYYLVDLDLNFGEEVSVDWFYCSNMYEAIHSINKHYKAISIENYMLGKIRSVEDIECSEINENFHKLFDDNKLGNS